MSTEKVLIHNDSYYLAVDKDSVYYHNFTHPQGKNLGLDRFHSRRPYTALSLTYGDFFGQRRIKTADFFQSDAGVEYFRYEDSVPGYTRVARIGVVTDDHLVDDYEIKVAQAPVWRRTDIHRFFESVVGNSGLSGGAFELRFARSHGRHSGHFPLEMVEAYLPYKNCDSGYQPYFVSNFVATGYISPDFSPESNYWYRHSQKIGDKLGWRQLNQLNRHSEVKKHSGLNIRVDLEGPAEETVIVNIRQPNTRDVPESRFYQFVITRNLTVQNSGLKNSSMYGVSSTLSGRFPALLSDLVYPVPETKKEDLLARMKSLESLLGGIIVRPDSL